VKRIEIRVGEDCITLRLDGEGLGAVQSTLQITESDADFEAEYRQDYNSAIDGLESLVLAHACTGIDVQDARYVAGIGTALDAISNHMT
jgi:hypothetical protein